MKDEGLIVRFLPFTPFIGICNPDAPKMWICPFIGICNPDALKIGICRSALPLLPEGSKESPDKSVICLNSYTPKLLNSYFHAKFKNSVFYFAFHSLIRTLMLRIEDTHARERK